MNNMFMLIHSFENKMRIIVANPRRGTTPAKWER